MRRWLSFLLALLLASACAHKQPKKATGLTEAAFWKDQKKRFEATNAISAKLHLHYEARKESVSGKGRMISQLPQDLRLELRDPLGRVQYLVALSGDSFVAYYPTQKRAYVDKQSGEAYMRRFLGVSFTFKDLQSLLLGLLPPDAHVEKFDSWRWVPEDEVYRGEVKSHGMSLVADVDPDTAALRALDWHYKGDTARVTYSDFSSCCGDRKLTQLAGDVSVALEHVKSKVEAEWDDVVPLEQPKPRDTFTVALPEGVQQIFLP